jgi:siderophore synthetase component
MTSVTLPADPVAAINRAAATDPLDDPDTARGAEALATEMLLRCWLRETGVAVPADGLLPIDLPATGTQLLVPVNYRSETGWHRLGRPLLASGRPADTATVAALVVREVSARSGAAGHLGADAVSRILDSTRRIAAHLAARRAAPDDPAGTPPFLSAEQALLLGHPFHPAPKSREGATDRAAAALSPELRGSFPLHWFAAHRDVVSYDGGDVPGLTRGLAGPALTISAGAVAVPAHPWQARDLLDGGTLDGLLAAGLLHDLGPAGPAWHPTSSLRTLYRPAASHQLKLSLGLRITNSRRNNLRSELALGVAAARLLDAGLAAALRAAHPSFQIVRDPAWLGVDVPGTTESGLELALRDNPFDGSSRTYCIAGLIADRPDGDASQLAGIAHRIAAQTGRPVRDVTGEWFARYLEVVVAPVLWLYARHGVAVEAHHQNTLVTLDRRGWPVAGWYRDSQGYYVTESRIDRLRELLPGFPDDAVFPDALVDERLGYYLGVNNLLGLVGALGAQELADETLLLRQVRVLIGRTAREHGITTPAIVHQLLSAKTLRCKANLLTCVDGRDELAGDVAQQSVYVDIANPIAAARP